MTRRILALAVALPVLLAACALPGMNDVGTAEDAVT